jgi:RNA polymerase sigma-70 factor (ECF subfamily)
LASERFARRPPAAYLESELLRQAIARAKAGDIDALHFLYVRFADDVCGYVASIVSDQHEAEDVTHTLFVSLRTEIHRYEQRDVPFGAWILSVARNAALGQVRARGDAPFEVRTSEEGRG